MAEKSHRPSFLGPHQAPSCPTRRSPGQPLQLGGRPGASGCQAHDFSHRIADVSLSSPLFPLSTGDCALRPIQHTHTSRSTNIIHPACQSTSSRRRQSGKSGGLWSPGRLARSGRLTSCLRTADLRHADNCDWSRLRPLSTLHRCFKTSDDPVISPRSPRNPFLGCFWCRIRRRGAG